MARKETPKPETVNSATRSAESIPSDERIRLRAYEIYNARRNSGVYGDAASDWTAAERELQTRKHRTQPRFAPLAISTSDYASNK